MVDSAELARLRAEVEALKHERTAVAERASERIRRERDQIQAEAARIKVKTKDLLAAAKGELLRLSREHGALTAEVAELRSRNRALEARLAEAEQGGRGRSAGATGAGPAGAGPAGPAGPAGAGAAGAAGAKGGAPGRGKLATTFEAPAPGAHAGRAGTAIIPIPHGLAEPEHPPLPVRPPRPDFVKKTQVIAEGKAAVWQDAAKQVRVVDTKGGSRKKAARAERRALASDDLDSKPEIHIESIEESGD